MDFLDGEILNEIFLRLPVKSLVQLKCIKKHYNSLISNPLFIQQHLTNSLQNPQNLLITTTPLQSIDLQKWPAVTLKDGATTTLGHFTRTPDRPTKILGSCHGLICMIFDCDSWTLLNPATREFIEIPKPKYRPRSTVDNFFGFGYDESTDDYKLLRGTCSTEKDSTPWELPARLEVLSFKSGSWLEMGEITEYRIFGKNRVGTYHKGCVYWLIEKKKEHAGWCFNYHDIHDYEGMLKYDFATGKFEEEVVKLPEVEEYGDCFEIEGLTALPAGRLLLYGGNGSSQITGWILNENDVDGEAWTKMYDYKWEDEPRKGFRTKSKVVQIGEDGKITANVCLRQLSQMQYYDPAIDENKKEDFDEDPHCVDSCVYAESLVSPYSVFWQRGGGRAGLRRRSKKMLRATV